MFFHISSNALQNYPCHWQLGNFVVSTDQGWKLTSHGSTQILYKGYADHGLIDSLLPQILDSDIPVLTGNFCVLAVEKDCLTVRTDLYRSFPIYVDHSSVNNLIKTNQTIWADSVVSVNSDFSINEVRFDVIGKIDPNSLTRDQVLQEIVKRLDAKTCAFVNNNTYPIKIFLSGGVDSLLVYSFLKKHTSKFNLVLGEHLDWDYFWMKNSGDITKNWGYNQIHHWNDDCVLTSGSPGDEFMLRGPVTTDLFLKYHGITIADLLKESQWKDCYSSYFMRSSYQEIFSTQKPTSKTTSQLHWDLCNIIVNDWQHWHLGRTLTWTPLRDLEIFKLMLNLSPEEAIPQIMNSQLSIDIIEHNCPGLSAAISKKKNVGNSLANLADFVL